MTEVTNTAAMEGSATANSHRRSQYDFFNSTEKDYIKKLARSWYELPTKRRNSQRSEFLDTELAKFRALYEDKFHPEDRAAVKSVSLLL